MLKLRISEELSSRERKREQKLPNSDEVAEVVPIAAKPVERNVETYRIRTTTRRKNIEIRQRTIWKRIKEGTKCGLLRVASLLLTSTFARQAYSDY